MESIGLSPVLERRVDQPQLQSERKRFCEGLKELCTIIYSSNPDIVIVPYRGGGVLQWGVEAYAELAQLPQLPWVPIPVGERTHIDDSFCGDSFTTPEMQKISQAYIQTASEIGRKIHNTVIIDESRSGASILTTTKAVRWALEHLVPDGNFSITSVMAQDENYSSSSETMKPIRYVTWRSVRMPMPFIDAQKYLPRILTRKPDVTEPAYEPWELVECDPSTDTKTAFLALIQEYL